MTCDGLSMYMAPWEGIRGWHGLCYCDMACASYDMARASYDMWHYLHLTVHWTSSWHLTPLYCLGWSMIRWTTVHN